MLKEKVTNEQLYNKIEWFESENVEHYKDNWSDIKYKETEKWGNKWILCVHLHLQGKQLRIYFIKSI